MPVPSKEPLTAAEQKRLEEKVALWKASKIGRELVRKVGKKTVEGIVWSVEQDDFTGPPAKVTSTYHVLWDVEGFNHSKKRLLKAMMPGDESSESELLTEGQLDGDADITLRTAFSHPELISPIQILQAKSWRWRSLKPEQQHALLDWTPNRELADRKAAQKRMGDAVLAQLKQENNADVKGRGRGAASQNGRTAKRRKPAPADAKEDEEDEEEDEEDEEDIEVPIDEDGSDEETSEDGQQEVVPAPKPRGKPANRQQPPAKKQPPAKQPPAKKQRGPATRTSAAGAGAGPSAPRAPPSPGSASGEPVAGSAESEEMQDAVSNQSGGTHDGQGLDDFMPDPKVMSQQRAAAKAAASGKKATSAAGGDGGAGSKADGSKASGSRGGSGRAGGAGSGKAKKAQASAQPTRQLPSHLAEAGPSDDGEMVTLLPGSVPPRVPMRLTLSDGDKLLQEYRNQAFAADEEFEPEHMVAERPAGAPREYLVKWRNYELDPHDWSAYSDLAETAVLDAWEAEHPPPQGAGKPPPPPEPVPAPTRGKSGAGGGSKKKRK